MISERLKKILKDYEEDLRNNNLDPIFNQLKTSYDLIIELQTLLTKQGIDPLRYVTIIPRRYYKDDNLNTLNLSSYINIKSIDKYAFDNSEIDTLVLPQSIKELEKGAFSSASIKNLNLPEGIRKIPVSCFEQAYISELKIPNSVLSIDHYAFYSTKINNLYLPDSLEKVANDVFIKLRCQSVIYKGKKYNTDTITKALRDNGVQIV